MTENELKSLIQSWENLPLIIAHVSQCPDQFDVLMDVALDDTQQGNWRSIYMVDKIHDQYPDLVEPFIPVMIDFLMVTNDDSKKRHLLKLISAHAIPEDKVALLLNYCIETFTNAALPVAVRVHAMQILFNIAVEEPDFAGELIELIDHEMDYHGSAGIISRGKRLLKKLWLMKNGSAG